MRLKDVSSLQENAKQFFAEVYIPFLEQRIQSLQNEVLEDSRFVLQWSTMIALENAKTVLTKLTNYGERLKGYQGIPENTEIDAQSELMKISYKTIEHLLRAQEVIANQVNNSNKSAQYIRVEHHKVQAELVNAVQGKLQKLLLEYPTLTANTQQKKSWLTNVLRLSSALMAIRVVAFGLFKRAPFGDLLPEGHELQANQDLREISSQLEKIVTVTLPPCGKTREMMDCINAKDRPGEKSVHFKYCPEVEAPLAKFKRHIAATPVDQRLEPNVIFAQVKADYPKPN